MIIDEAHHVPAPTWQRIINNMKHAASLLVTATPFRLDKKEIQGKYIYYYPLSKAYRDGIFGSITFIPIDEAPNKDQLLAAEAERVLLNDRADGYEHFLLVRTDTKEKCNSRIASKMNCRFPTTQSLSVTQTRRKLLNSFSMRKLS